MAAEFLTRDARQDRLKEKEIVQRNVLRSQRCALIFYFDRIFYTYETLVNQQKVKELKNFNRRSKHTIN